MKANTLKLILIWGLLIHVASAAMTKCEAERSMFDKNLEVYSHVIDGVQTPQVFLKFPGSSIERLINLKIKRRIILKNEGNEAKTIRFRARLVIDKKIDSKKMKRFLKHSLVFIDFPLNAENSHISSTPSQIIWHVPTAWLSFDITNCEKIVF